MYEGCWLGGLLRKMAHCAPLYFSYKALQASSLHTGVGEAWWDFRARLFGSE